MGGLTWAELEVRAATILMEGVTLVSRSAQEANTPANATTSILDDLRFSAAKSIRTSIITLASFNVLAAVVTLACVIWDCYLAARRKDVNLGIGGLRPRHVGSSQVYPLVLSLGIITQGIIFAAAQARGLGALLIDGCVNISQIMMPATFLVPFLQLIFGLEMTIRTCLSSQWPPRKIWNVPLCIAITVAGLLALYGVTLSLRPPDQCFASLFWFTQAWRPVCFGLLVGVAGALLIAGFVIFFRLRQHPGLPTCPERMAASQMVYYIVIAVVSNALLAPFFYTITFGDQNDSADYPMELSTVSSIVANLSGLMTGGLYLFLRGGRKLTNPFNVRNSFDERQCNPPDEKQNLKDLAGPDRHHRDSSPSMYSQDAGSYWPRNAARESTSTYPYGPGNLIDANNPSFYPTIADQRTTSFAAQKKARHSERSSYSIFSQGSVSGVPSTTLLPSTTYTRESGKMSPASKPDSMLMPPPLFTSPNTVAHQRSSSVGSSATVQIGLRISNMNDMQSRGPSKPYSPRHTPLRSPGPALTPTQSCTAAPRSPLAAPVVPSGHSRNESNGSDLNKELPKTPPESPSQGKQKEPCQLSPTVYEPQKQPPKAKLASPKGVGFQMYPIDRAVKSPLPVASPPAQGNPGWI